MEFNFSIHYSSDSAILVQFGDLPSLEITAQVLELHQTLQQKKIVGVTNLHPGYNSLLVDFDLRKVEPETLFKELKQICANLNPQANRTAKLHEILVHTDLASAPDLADVSKYTGLNPAEIYDLLTKSNFTVAFIGFSPGFPYLLGLPSILSCPRKLTPRHRVPAGSFAIGGNQLGLYPSESPGGWQLIGRTDQILFDPYSKEPSFFSPGDQIKFKFSSGLNNVSRKITSRQNLVVKSENLLEIQECNSISSVQDFGRLDLAHLGISQGGAADPVALRIGNRLLGNSENQAAIEVSLGSLVVKFLADSWIAVAGADCVPSLDQQPIAMWTTIPVCAGQHLSLQSPRSNLRSYLCLQGGISSESLHGSRSSFTSGNWGGHQGRYLQKADRLTFGDGKNRGVRFKKVKNFIFELYSQDLKQIRVCAGPQKTWFTQESQAIFLQQKFLVTEDLNRQGIRLQAESLNLSVTHQGQELMSEGVANGAIQVTTGGQAMILFCEQHTTGGYAKIANVIDADLFKLGQLRAGDQVSFIEVSIEDAWNIKEVFEKGLQEAVDDF